MTSTRTRIHPISTRTFIALGDGRPSGYLHTRTARFNRLDQGGAGVTRKRRKARNRILVLGICIFVLAGGGWWFWPRGESNALAQTGVVAAADRRADPGPKIPDAIVVDRPAQTVLASSTRVELKLPPEELLTPRNASPPKERRTQESPPEPAARVVSAASLPDPARTPTETENGPGAAASDTGEVLATDARIDAAWRKYQAGQRLAARHELNRMLAEATPPADQRELRRHLAQIADETIFSRGTTEGDPLVVRHKVEPGQYLVHLQKRYAVPYEMIMRINGIKNASNVGAGRVLKIPRGPFHAVIHKSAYRLDLYLQDLYVRSFRVGLGADSSTPIGGWIVKDRLTNPTYYPPSSAQQRRIIPPDDPANPLGEFWVGLRGVSGDAEGQVGFGIHGTIEPESIGRNASMGCVRMFNEDIDFVYGSLLPDKSNVTTVP